MKIPMMYLLKKLLKFGLFLRLKGKGIPDVNGYGSGDLMVKVGGRKMGAEVEDGVVDVS
jgi:hypothetical protein